MSEKTAYARAVSDAYRETIAEARSEFSLFVRLAWSRVDPSPFIPSWHIGAMCERLQALADGEIPNLVILVPPGTAKSLVSSVLFPAWRWIREPSERFLASSHSRSISARDTVRSRSLIRSPWFQAHYPGVSLLKDMDTTTRFANDAGGWRIATSTGSSATGERADWLLIDDANDLSAAYYPDQLALAKQHYDTVLRSRGTGERTRTLIIAQRVAYDDLPAHVLDQAEAGGEPFETLILPMRYSPTFQMVLPGGGVHGPDPRDERRPGGTHEGGDLLFPALYPEATVKRLEVSYANRAPAILQQSPGRSLGRMFDVDNVRNLYLDNQGGRHDIILEDPAGARVYDGSRLPRLITVDLAVSTSSTADYTVMLTSAISPEGDLLIVDMLRERIEGPILVPTLRRVYQEWRPARLLVESVGFQLSVIQAAQREGLPVEPVYRERGEHKQARAIPLGTLLAEGKVYVRADLPGREDFLREINLFPGGAHDDIIDAASDASREVSLGAYWTVRPYDDDESEPGVGRYAEGLPFGPGESQFVEPELEAPGPFGGPAGIPELRDPFGGDAM